MVGAGGFGTSIAFHLAARGAEVALVDRSTAALRDVRDGGRDRDAGAPDRGRHAARAGQPGGAESTWRTTTGRALAYHQAGSIKVARTAGARADPAGRDRVRPPARRGDRPARAGRGDAARAVAAMSATRRRCRSSGTTSTSSRPTCRGSTWRPARERGVQVAEGVDRHRPRDRRRRRHRRRDRRPAPSTRRPSCWRPGPGRRRSPRPLGAALPVVAGPARAVRDRPDRRHRRGARRTCA